MMRTLLLGANIGVPLAWVTGGFEPNAFIAMFIVHMLTLYATLMPGCGWWGPVQTRMEGSGDVWLTIDDGPDGDHTRAAMDLLEAKGARATFFIIGERAQADPDLVREIAKRGHGIGNHTLTHPAKAFWRLGPIRLKREIADAGEAFEEILGEQPRLFRAPAGMRNMFVHPILKRYGFRLIGWSARGYDGREDDVERIVARIAKGLIPGAIVLLHEDRRTPEGRSLLLETLPRVLDEIERRGLEISSPSSNSNAY